jgi:multicomponent Na+:H+ antiporter subunit A
VEDSELLIEISQWHGINREIIMTLGVVIIGIILYKTVKKWSKVYNYYPEVLTLNSIYESAIEKLEDLSLSITKRYMTGFVRDYLIYILGWIYLPGYKFGNFFHNTSSYNISLFYVVFIQKEV